MVILSTCELSDANHTRQPQSTHRPPGAWLDAAELPRSGRRADACRHHATGVGLAAPRAARRRCGAVIAIERWTGSRPVAVRAHGRRGRAVA